MYVISALIGVILLLIFWLYKLSKKLGAVNLQLDLNVSAENERKRVRDARDELNTDDDAVDELHDRFRRK